MDNAKEYLARMILDYLRRHPDAGDTLEGISKWWLEVERINRTVDEVANAIEFLRIKGTLKIIKLENGTLKFKIN